jgi:hypothetical protein
MADDKKRVLYLSREMFHNNSISDGLEGYDVVSFIGENIEDLPAMLRTPPEYRDIDALVTCVPHNLITHSYDRSLEILRQVRKDYPKLQIIAYTAACSGDAVRFATQRSINAVIQNRGALWHDEDAKKVKETLDALFSEEQMYD